MKIRLLLSAACIAFVVLVFATAARSAVIDLDAQVIGDYHQLGTKVDVTLDAGTYLVTPVSLTFESWNAWAGGAAGCDVNGTNCSSGWSNQYIVETLSSSDVPLQPVGGADAFYSTSALAFSKAVSFQLTLSSTQDVSFFLSDNAIANNLGGMSLEITTIPVPGATWLFGVGLISLIGAARRKCA